MGGIKKKKLVKPKYEKIYSSHFQNDNRDIDDKTIDINDYMSSILAAWGSNYRSSSSININVPVRNTFTNAYVNTGDYLTTAHDTIYE